MTLPTDFWWGTTSSAVGAEGVAPAADWSRWERDGRAPRSLEGAGFVTNHADDLSGLAELGFTGQRITIEWARLEPTPGALDGDAVEYYRGVFQAAREAGIDAWATLVHGSLPGWFADDERGFRDPDGVARTWARHVDRVGELFEDVVAGWTPIEDPVGWAVRGHLLGTRPPGRRDPVQAREAVAGALEATWEAWRLLRSGRPPVMGVFGLPTVFAHEREPGDGAEGEARRWEELLWVSWIDAVRDGVLRVPGRAPVERDGLADAFDLVGVAFDHPIGVTADGALEPHPRGAPVAGSGFAPLPEELGVMLRRLDDELPGRALVVASTGVGTDDDDWRSELLRQTVAQVEAATADGVDVRGLFWDTSVDGYDWSTGFGQPRGLLDDGRTPKPSMRWLQTRLSDHP